MTAKIAPDTQAQLWDDSVVILQGDDVVILSFTMASKLRIALEAFENRQNPDHGFRCIERNQNER